VCQLAQAKNNLDTLLVGPDATALDIAQNAVDQAQIAEQQAQRAAPFDGVVTAINITPGQNASTSSQSAIQLADLNNLEIVVDLAETDLNRVKVGDDTQITLDALPNATLQGKVIQIAPAGVLTQGVVNYPVTIQLTNPSRGVKTGMTANLNIIVQQRDNVLMVPNRAVKAAAAGAAAYLAPGAAPNSGAASGQNGSQGQRGARNGSQNGQRSGAGGAQNDGQNGGFAGTGRRPTRQQFVTVLQNGQQVQVPVQTGLSNDTMTEIVSGLNEGDVVVVNTPTTTQPRAGGPGLGIPGVGGFGRG
jgi:HlyD family secretion protein